MPVPELLMYLSATFLLGLALGWAIWHLGAKQEIGAMMSERDFWKNSFDGERLKTDTSRSIGDDLDEDDGQPSKRGYSRTRASRAL